MEKVVFGKYKGKFDRNICEELFKDPETADLEEVRAQFYGYVFTEEYRNHEIPDMFNMDYWDELNQEYDSPQTELLEKIIESTGDGESPDTAYFVICVGNEYDFMERVNPFNFLERKKQSLIHNGDKYIDCWEFEENDFGIDKVYFDVTALFKYGFNSI